LLLAKASHRVNFTDNEWPERVAQRDRWRQKGMSIRPNLERYWWELSTEGRINSMELDDHFEWILKQLRKKKLLKTELSSDYRFSLSVFWGASNGTGGGPLIDPELSAKFALHGIPVAIGFYVSE
jgi:hypothetical protein